MWTFYQNLIVFVLRLLSAFVPTQSSSPRSEFLVDSLILQLTDFTTRRIVLTAGIFRVHFDNGCTFSQQHTSFLASVAGCDFYCWENKITLSPSAKGNSTANVQHIGDLVTEHKYFKSGTFGRRIMPIYNKFRIENLISQRICQDFWMVHFLWDRNESLEQVILLCWFPKFHELQNPLWGLRIVRDSLKRFARIKPWL